MSSKDRTAYFDCAHGCHTGMIGAGQCRWDLQILSRSWTAQLVKILPTQKVQVLAAIRRVWLDMKKISKVLGVRYLKLRIRLAIFLRRVARKEPKWPTWEGLSHACCSSWRLWLVRLLAHSQMLSPWLLSHFFLYFMNLSRISLSTCLINIHDGIWESPK